jgi:DNA polymerase III delta prime subunit
MMEEVLWVEKYRPKTIEECILHDSIKSTFQDFANKKQIPNILLSGTAGVGKTTVAKALCEEVGCDYLVINGSDERGIAVMQNTVKNYATSMSLSGGRKVIILDEADNLTADAQKALRGMMEEVSHNCSFIFTCNFAHKILEPIHSRCSVINFKMNGQKVKMASAFMKRVEFILTTEGIQFDKESVAAIITKYFPDNRRVLNELQKYSSSGVIDKGILSNIIDVEISDLIVGLKEKDFKRARKWVINNLDKEPEAIFRKLYDSMYDFMKPQSIPQLVILIDDYQDRIGRVADPEITLVAFLTSVMMNCEFK